MNYIFRHNFYIQFKAPNSEQLIAQLNTETNIDNSSFNWGDKCEVDRVPLRYEDYLDLLQPSVEELSKRLGKPFAFQVGDPWLNIYSQGGYQELHDHWDEDIAGVFFLNDGNNFYFRERHNTEISFPMRKLMECSEYWTPNVRAGDFIFFPAHMLHGVSKNTSKELRKTLSCNYKLLDN